MGVFETVVAALRGGRQDVPASQALADHLHRLMLAGGVAMKGSHPVLTAEQLAGALESVAAGGPAVVKLRGTFSAEATRHVEVDVGVDTLLHNLLLAFPGTTEPMA